jgi:hypothetical protein
MPSVSRAFVGWRRRAAIASGAVLLLAGGLVVVTGSVAVAAISAQGVNFNATEFFNVAQTVGTFTDTTPSPDSGYTVSVNWGDGKTTDGQVTTINGTYTVIGSPLHTYVNDGIYTVTFSITETGDDHDSATATAVATVGEQNRGLFVTVPPLNASEGTVVSGTIATFSDPGTTDPAADFTATIDWGDGTTTAGVVSNGSAAGDYVVTGTHQYTDELSSPTIALLNVTISEPGLGSNSSGNIVTITEADTLTMTGSSFAARPKTPFSGIVATFTDTNPSALASDFATTINWGDGTTTSGTVTGATGGPFTVTGSHTYERAGTFSVTVTAADDPPGTATASATATATVTHGRPPSG